MGTITFATVAIVVIFDSGVEGGVDVGVVVVVMVIATTRLYFLYQYLENLNFS